MIQVMGAGRQKCKSDKACTHLIPGANLIHFIESGHGYFNGRLLSGGMGFVCRNDRICDYVPLASDPWTYSWINVLGNEAEELLDRLPLEDDVFTWNTVADAAVLRELDPENEWSCLGVLYRMCASLTEAAPRNYAESAKKLMQCRFAEGITVEQVARELNLSRAYLRNVFFRQTGRSPQQYLMELKMQRAEELLPLPYSITEIARACGYGDVMQFSKIFKKYHGRSPCAYRKELL